MFDCQQIESRNKPSIAKMQLFRIAPGSVPPFASVFGSHKATTCDLTSLSGRCEIRRESAGIVRVIVVVIAVRVDRAGVIVVVVIR